jgi:CBS domain-containing protein/nucleotide-binding universal stress UspA family protein
MTGHVARWVGEFERWLRGDQERCRVPARDVRRDDGTGGGPLGWPPRDDRREITAESAVRVRDWMSLMLITVTPETSVSAAWDLMRERRVRHLLIVRVQRLLGILSDRDIRLALPSPATSLSQSTINYLLMNLKVDSIMTRSPVTIGLDHPVSEAAMLMLERRIGALPVVSDSTLQGIITQTDVLRAFSATVDREAPGSCEQPVTRTILVPLDLKGDHSGVLSAARALAKRAPAGLRLVHVAPMPAATIDRNGRIVSYLDREAARAKDELTRELAAAAVNAKDVPIDFTVRFGDPVGEIVHEAEATDVDLIVMATHRRTGVRRLIQGSIAEDIERATTRPVLLVPYESARDPSSNGASSGA